MHAASALLLAVDLYRDPRRVELVRDAPLPDDIGSALALLSGRAGRLDAAASGIGVDPGELLAAVRLYVRKAMLHPDADDARMLGLTASSTPGDLKRNYRALQSWLHPDRFGAPEDAGALSARVNAAWSRLRDPLQAGAGDTAADYRPHWRRVEVPASRPVFRGLAVAAAGLGLVALGWLALSRTDMAPEAPTGPASTVAGGPRVATPGTPRLERVASASVVEPDEVDGDLAAALAVELEQRDLPLPSLADRAGALPGARFPEVKLRAIHLKDSGPGATAQAASPEAAVAQTGLGPSPARPGSAEPPAAAPAKVVSAAAIPVPQAPPADDPPAAPAPPAAVAALIDDARADSARAQAATLLGFLAQRAGGAPPIWHSGRAYDQAEHVRRTLVAGRDDWSVRMLREVERWRFEPEYAELRVPVEPADRALGVRIVQANLQWKDDSWWVERVTLELPQ